MPAAFAASVTLVAVSRCFVDNYCGDFGFLVSLDIQGKKSYDVSPGQFVAERAQLQVDVKNGVSLASLFHRVVDHWFKM